ncbi:hypothetical protein MRX96_044263 [Rhipicephalus microplus]
MIVGESLIGPPTVTTVTGRRRPSTTKGHTGATSGQHCNPRSGRLRRRACGAVVDVVGAAPPVAVALAAVPTPVRWRRAAPRQAMPLLRLQLTGNAARKGAEPLSSPNSLLRSLAADAVVLSRPVVAGERAVAWRQRRRSNNRIRRRRRSPTSIGGAFFDPPLPPRYSTTSEGAFALRGGRLAGCRCRARGSASPRDATPANRCASLGGVFPEMERRMAMIRERRLLGDALCVRASVRRWRPSLPTRH